MKEKTQRIWDETKMKKTKNIIEIDVVCDIY